MAQCEARHAFSTIPSQRKQRVSSLKIHRYLHLANLESNYIKLSMLVHASGFWLLNVFHILGYGIILEDLVAIVPKL